MGSFFPIPQFPQPKGFKWEEAKLLIKIHLLLINIYWFFIVSNKMIFLYFQF